MVFQHSSVINYVMLAFSVRMAIYSIVGPNICQVSVQSSGIVLHCYTGYRRHCKLIICNNATPYTMFGRFITFQESLYKLDYSAFFRTYSYITEICYFEYLQSLLLGWQK